MMKRAHAFVALAGAAAAVVGILARTARNVGVSRSLVRDTERFSVETPDVRGRVLIAGDSTALGVGAGAASSSLAGLLGLREPLLAIDNVGAVGARFADVVQQLATAPARCYDAIVILAGGNDMIRFTSRHALQDSLARIARRAKAMAPLVVTMPAGNLGNAPFFVAPLSWVVSARSRAVHAVVRESAQRNGLAYVNLYRDKARDPFAQAPARLLAADGLHPSDAGYALWLEELYAQAPLAVALHRALGGSRYERVERAYQALLSAS